jgi:cell division protein FtsB
VSVKAVLDAVNDSLRKRVVNIRAEVDKLKNKELNIINTMTKILETERETENTVTTEEFASMAL